MGVCLVCGMKEEKRHNLRIAVEVGWVWCAVCTSECVESIESVGDYDWTPPSCVGAEQQ